MIEQIFQDYEKAYGLQFVSLRYFNAAGADPEGELGESHNPETHLIPIALDAAGGQREQIQVFGTDYDTSDGSCIRDYIHVADLADAHIHALSYLEQGGNSDCFNLGQARGSSVLEVIESVKRVTGKDFCVVKVGRRPGDPARLVGSSKKATKVLRWNPKYSDLDTIVKHAWNWHEHGSY